MKLTKRQLNKIITESLGIQSKVITEAVNFRKIRKDLFALKADIDNQALLDKVSDHADKLKAKVDAGETKFFKGRYQEAVTLLASLEDLLKAPTPEKIKDVTEEPIIEDPPEPTPEPTEPEPTEPEPTPWNPDPDPKVDWEYQVRECIWYTRKKETTKEYKLGHASGKPLEKGGKFLNSIVKLNNAYPDLVKDCNPMVKKPTPKKPEPKPKPSVTEAKTIEDFSIAGGKIKNDGGKASKYWSELTGAVKMYQTVSQDSTILGKYKEATVGKQGSSPMNASVSNNMPDGASYTNALEFYKAVKDHLTNGEGILKLLQISLQIFRTSGQKPFQVVVEYAIIDTSPEGTNIFTQGRTSTMDFGSSAPERKQALSGLKAYFKLTDDDWLAKEYFNGGFFGPAVQTESLSRGALYRRRYYGRY
jgi:hypothetical protein